MDFTLNTCPVQDLNQYRSLRAMNPDDIIPCAGEPVCVRDGRLQVYAADGNNVRGWYDIRDDIFYPEV